MRLFIFGNLRSGINDSETRSRTKDSGLGLWKNWAAVHNVLGQLGAAHIVPGRSPAAHTVLRRLGAAHIVPGRQAAAHTMLGLSAAACWLIS